MCVCSYEDLLLESSDEEGEQGKKKKAASKTSLGQLQAVSGGRGRAWIREGNEDDEPLNFLDPSVAKRVSGDFK